MNKNINRVKIPGKFKIFFWDVDFNKLDLKKHRKFVLERLLNYGTFDTFNWIFSTFNDEEVKDLINEKGVHSLSRNSFLFWGKIVKEKKLWQNNLN